MKVEFRAITNGGIFRAVQSTDWVRWQNAQPDAEWMFSPRRAGLPRKLNQNRIYWKRNAELISQPEIDLTADGLHNFLLCEAGFAKLKIFRGRDIYERESSTSLTVAEFSKLMAEQDRLAEFCNLDRAFEHYLFLTTGDKK